MKEKIERFSKGDFDYKLPYIYLSEESVELTVEAGKVYEGSFIVRNSASKPMKGIVCSSHRLLTLKEPTFSGTEIEIFYQFNASSLESGDTIQGVISIISDCGEQMMHFEVHVEAAFIMTSLGKMKDLNQFTNLARMDWSEAKKIFRSDKFERMFLQSDNRVRKIYHNLLKNISTSQALEEFLIAIDKKSKVHLSIDKRELKYEINEDQLTDKLTLSKEQWGYVEIKVSTDADFIQLDKKYIWGDFFLGSNYSITFILDPKKMRYGINYGRIWVKTVYQTIEIPIICRRHREVRKPVAPEKMLLKVQAAFHRNYLMFRLNQIDRSKYLEESYKLLQHIPDETKSSAKELILAHLAIITGNNDEAEQLLNELATKETSLRKQSVIAHSAYHYLKALYKRDEETIDRAVEKIRAFYEKGHFYWQLLWFLLYIDRRYEGNKGLKLMDIKEQFEAGCTSPILYYEAALIYNDEPYLLRELTAFEVQVLNFSIRNKLATKETAQQYAYLANKKKHFYPIIYRGMVALYEQYSIKEILTVICCMLIKGIKKSNKYHRWYYLGVMEQLPITELYEYFMYSIEETSTDPLPQQVLLYFIYNSNLNDSKRAFLYAYIIKNKQKHASIYRSYYKKMELFAAKQLEAHNINHNLAVLYQEFYGNGSIPSEVARNLPFIIYRHEFLCNNPNITSVRVIHEELDLEENIPISDGKAYIDIFSNNVMLLPVDSNGNNYIVTIDYSIQPFMNPELYEDICIAFSNHPKLLIHLFDKYQSNHILSDYAIALRKKILLVEGLNNLYYYDCLGTLIEYYNEYFNDELLEYYLKLIDLKMVDAEARSQLLEYMIKGSLYGKVLDALETFGYESVPDNLLVRFCSGWLTSGNAQPRQEFIVHLCYYLFDKNKYDEAILEYLVLYYYGATKEMLRIWKAAKGFEVETHGLESRLLVQMLFTEGYVQDSFLIFNEYYKNVTNHMLVRAFLSFYAYKYLIHDWVINTELFQMMRREISYEKNDLCLLAWLKYNTSRSEFSENDLVFIEYQIHRFVKEGIILPFFEQYKSKVKLPEIVMNKYFVEYKTDPKKQVYIHYRLQNANDKEEYITERMTNVFMGIHVKAFVLFYNETLEYYITEESGEEVVHHKSIQVHNDREPSDEESRYQQINLMLAHKEMHDETSLLELMERYMNAEYLTSKCFRVLDQKE
ncbi:MAG: hypothetical protein GX359_11265 [Clostridiales bacterium]|nr:hypothetical protein [Clostridiales bacterium]